MTPELKINPKPRPFDWRPGLVHKTFKSMWSRQIRRKPWIARCGAWYLFDIDYGNLQRRFVGSGTMGEYGTAIEVGNEFSLMANLAGPHAPGLKPLLALAALYPDPEPIVD